MPAYRERLRLEGLTLAGCGAVAAVALLLAAGGATAGARSTLVQLVAVAVLMAVAGSLATRRAMAAAVPVGPGDAAGEPTPLWQLPLIVGGLTVAFGIPAGWDAGLRVAGGCVIVGLAQAVLIERLVAAEERRSGGRFVRVPGSSLFTGTKLGRRP